MSRPTINAAQGGIFSDAESTDDDLGYDSSSDDVDLDGINGRMTMEEELQLQQEEEEEEEELRETGIYTFLKRPAVVYPMEILQIFLCLLWCGAYVYLADRQFVYPALLRGLMYGWVFFFVAFWTWKVIVKENRLKFMISLFAIVDYLTLIPFFVDSEFLNPLMSLRVVGLWRLFRVFPTTLGPIVRSILKLICSIFMLVYISAAFLLAVEPEVMKNFITASYFATVTISTVGYGDLHMSRDAGRLLVVAIILTAFVFIPWQGYFLSKIIAMTPAPWQRSLDVDVRKYRHVVLMGKITRQRVSMFLREFLTPNNDNYRVVILDSEDQGAAFEKYIKDSGYWKRVRYYVGSPIADLDLHRVHLAEASAAFIWSDTSSASPEQADRMTVLTCLAVKSHSYWLKVYVEVILPETKARVGEVGPNMFVMSYQEIKNGALSRACEVDGLLAFCSVLLTTFGPPSQTPMDSNFTAHLDQTYRAPMLGVLPGHLGDQADTGPSPAQLADAALRRGESHESRIRASFSGRGASFKVPQTNVHHMHGSHRSFHYKGKSDKIKAKDLIAKRWKEGGHSLGIISAPVVGGISGSSSASPLLGKNANPFSGRTSPNDSSRTNLSHPPDRMPMQDMGPSSAAASSSSLFSDTTTNIPAGSQRYSHPDSDSPTDRPTLENAYKEYLHSRTCSIEILVVPQTFADRTFMEAASSLYTTYGVLLVGLRSMSGSLELNPGPSYTVRGGEAAYIIGRPRDVRLLRQTFDRMARGDGTGASTVGGKTLEYALDPRLEHSPFAPRSLKKSTADDSFTQSVQAAAAATLQERDPFEELKNTHHISTQPRTYLEAQKIPENKPPPAPKEGPKIERFKTFAPSGSSHNLSTTPSFGPPTPGLRRASGAAHMSHQNLFGPASGISFGYPKPSSATVSNYSTLNPGAATSTSAATTTTASSSSPSSPPMMHLHSPAAQSSSAPGNDSPLAASPPVLTSLSPPNTSSMPMANGSPSTGFVGLNDHIIFCSHVEAIDWYALVKPLRSKLVSVQRAIVIVTEYTIDEEQWEWLSFFPNLWVVEGSPLVASDLARAQIESCNTIVILSSPRIGEDEAVLDEKAIVVYNSVKAHFSHKRIVLDLAKPSNSRLVAPEVGRVGIYENPEFIAGHLYDAAIHDTIMAKSFDTPFLMEFTHALLNCNDTGVSLITVPVPENCRGVHFEALFSAFPECIPLGLLRRNPVAALRKFPYVCICPAPSVIVQSKDQIFLLAPAVFMLRRAAKTQKRAKRSQAASTRTSRPLI